MFIHQKTGKRYSARKCFHAETKMGNYYLKNEYFQL